MPVAFPRLICSIGQLMKLLKLAKLRSGLDTRIRSRAWLSAESESAYSRSVMLISRTSSSRPSVTSFMVLLVTGALWVLVPVSSVLAPFRRLY